MTALPQRESMLQRALQRIVAFVMSPLWMWTCFALLVAIFHKPILTIITSLTESPTLNLMILFSAIAAAIIGLTRQMITDLSL